MISFVVVVFDYEKMLISKMCKFVQEEVVSLFLPESQREKNNNVLNENSLDKLKYEEIISIRFFFHNRRNQDIKLGLVFC